MLNETGDLVSVVVDGLAGKVPDVIGDRLVVFGPDCPVGNVNTVGDGLRLIGGSSAEIFVLQRFHQTEWGKVEY